MVRTIRRARSAAAAGMLVALVVALSGCALFDGGAQAKPVARHTTAKPKPTHSAPVTPTPSPTPTPTTPAGPPPTLAPVPSGTAVAEASVASPKGSIHFHYRIVSNGDNTYSIQYSGFTSTVPIPVSVTLIDVPPQVGDGLTWHGVADHTLGGPTSGTAAASTAQLGYVGNPSYLGTLVTYSSAASADGVPVELGPDKVLAVNTVHWSIPERATNVHPVDGGARAGATGRVPDTTASGAPARYVVAAGDTFDGVAQRFGITSQDLLWLNPSGRAYDGALNLLQDQSLNLDPQAL
ncbi:MAG: LysM domain-containing protein [Leifsonia sp.]